MERELLFWVFQTLRGEAPQSLLLKRVKEAALKDLEAARRAWSLYLDGTYGPPHKRAATLRHLREVVGE